MKCKKQIIIGFAIILFALLLGTESMAATAIVNTDTLRLRKEASTDSTVITLLDKGEKLDVIEESGDWVKIKVKGITGFVHKDFVDIKEDEKQEENKEEIVSQENTIEEENIVKEDTTTEPENVIEENTNVDESQITEVEDTKDFAVRETSLIADGDVYILPLINSNKIGNLKKDAKVTLMDEVKGWFYIQADEFNGWVRSDKVEKIEEITTPADTNIQNPAQNQEDNKQEDNKQNEEENKVNEVAIDRKVMYVNYTSVYVRKGPGTENPVVDSLILNNQVTVIAESGDWYKVEVGNITGYIAKRLLSNAKTETTDRNAEEREDASANVNQDQEQQVNTNISNVQTPATSKGQEIVDFAKKYLGCRYVYGGSGPSTFDCSGFTMYVYKNFGINLSHSARAQSKNGVYVAKSDLQPGDLVFFKDYETMDGIGHCGIYIGDGNFIHASSGTGYCVKISTLLSGSYKTRYETARRLI